MIRLMRFGQLIMMPREFYNLYGPPQIRVFEAPAVGFSDVVSVNPDRYLLVFVAGPASVNVVPMASPGTQGSRRQIQGLDSWELTHQLYGSLVNLAWRGEFGVIGDTLMIIEGFMVPVDNEMRQRALNAQREKVNPKDVHRRSRVRGRATPRK